MIPKEESTSRRIRSYHRLLVCIIYDLGVCTSSRDFLELGIDLGTVGFQASFEGIVIGRMFFSSFLSALQTIIVCVALSTTSLALAPESVTKAHLSGRITPKSGDELAAIGKLFSQFLAGQNQTLSVQGNFVQPSGNAAVGWLSDAFKTLTLQVILPGHIYQVSFISCRRIALSLTVY
jgi:hypothetical protein